MSAAFGCERLARTLDVARLEIMEIHGPIIGSGQLHRKSTPSGPKTGQ
jgi:hypothetical protein